MVHNDVFGFSTFEQVGDPAIYHFDAPHLLDGADVYETICPINPFTGHRDNPLSILQYALTPQNQRLLDVVLAELPAIKEMNCSDDVKLDMLVSRFDSGTFAERDMVMKRLEKISDILFESKNTDVNSSVKESVTDTIKFDSSDTNSVTND